MGMDRFARAYRGTVILWATLATLHLVFAQVVMDRLPWTRFHWLVIIGLGVSWILDGLEIQIVSTVGTVLQDRATLHLSSGDVGLLGSVYLLGEVVGALVFGRITDLVGRKRMFIACLGLYLFASGIGGLCS